MTEDEAKTKRCVRPETGACIGSACMAWRYTNKTGMHDRSRWTDGPDKTADEAYAEYVSSWPLEGRCGLAGA